MNSALLTLSMAYTSWFFGLMATPAGHTRPVAGPLMTPRGGTSPLSSMLHTAMKPVLIDDNKSEEHTSELQSRRDLVCRLLLEKKNCVRHSAEQFLEKNRGQGCGQALEGDAPSC